MTPETPEQIAARFDQKHATETADTIARGAHSSVADLEAATVASADARTLTKLWIAAMVWRLADEAITRHVVEHSQMLIDKETGHEG